MRILFHSEFLADPDPSIASLEAVNGSVRADGWFFVSYTQSASDMERLRACLGADSPVLDALISTLPGCFEEQIEPGTLISVKAFGINGRVTMGFVSSWRRAIEKATGLHVSEPIVCQHEIFPGISNLLSQEEMEFARALLF